MSGAKTQNSSLARLTDLASKRPCSNISQMRLLGQADAPHWHVTPSHQDRSPMMFRQNSLPSQT